MRKPILLAALALSACATPRHVPPAVVVKTVEVDRPVAVACVAASDIPAMPPRVGDQMTGDASHDAGLLASSAIRLRAALDKALALLGACTFNPQ